MAVPRWARPCHGGVVLVSRGARRSPPPGRPLSARGLRRTPRSLPISGRRWPPQWEGPRCASAGTVGEVVAHERHLVPAEAMRGEQGSRGRAFAPESWRTSSIQARGRGAGGLERRPLMMAPGSGSVESASPSPSWMSNRLSSTRSPAAAGADVRHCPSGHRRRRAPGGAPAAPRVGQASAAPGPGPGSERPVHQRVELVERPLRRRIARRAPGRGASRGRTRPRR